MAFHKLVGNLEIAECFNLPLRIAPQQRVGTPQHVIGPQIAQQRAQNVGALERAAGNRRGEGGADFAVKVFALRLEAFQGRQLGVIRPGRVVGYEIQIEEIIRCRVEVLRVGVAGIELAERNALVAADVLDPVFATGFPDRVRQLLVVEPPALLLGRVESVELEAGDLVLVHIHGQTIKRHAQSLVRRQATSQHDGGLRPLVPDSHLILHGNHVLAAIILAEAERVENADGRIAFLEDQLAVILDVHVARAVRESEGLTQVVQQLHEPHATLGGIDPELIVAGACADVGMHVDDEIAAAGASDLDRFFLGIEIGSFRRIDLEEFHSGHFVGGQHCCGEA